MKNKENLPIKIPSTDPRSIIKKAKPSKAWKAVEARIADFFGAKRTPLSGKNSGHTRSDSLHPKLFIETKWRQKHSAVSLWRNTKESRDSYDSDKKKTVVVCLAEKNKNGFWVMCHSDDILEVAEEIKKANKEKGI